MLMRNSLLTIAHLPLLSVLNEINMTLKIRLYIISNSPNACLKQLLFWVFILVSGTIQAKTPSHVFQAVDTLANNIHQIRKHLKVTAQPREPGVQIAKTPLHVYAKGIEVYEKVNRYRESQGWPIAELPVLPSKKVAPADVFKLVKRITQDLEDTTSRLRLPQAANGKLPTGKTPSDVYENLWKCSYLMDGIVGAISPTFVHRNTLRIEAGLQQIAEKLNVNVNVAEIDPLIGKKPIDANIEGFKVLYKLVELEKKLNLPPVRVPGFPAGNISPSDVYDTTNNIIAEITRINVKLALPEVPSASLSKNKITPNNVVQQFIKIQSMLDILLQ